MTLDVEELDDPFRNSTYLSNYEALTRFSKLNDDLPNRFDFQRRIFESSLKYLEEFAQFTGEPQHNAAKEAIRTKLQQRDGGDESEPWSEAQDEEWRRQVEYDTVMLLNLCPTSVEEAQALIPSLSRKTPDQVQEMLDDLDSFRR
jgi:hypothetical protein